MKKLIRVKEVMELLGVSKSQIWKLTANGTLKSYKQSDRVTVWSSDEVEAYIKKVLGEVA